MESITHLIICSLFIFGIWNAFNPGFIFERADELLDKHLPEIIYKPLIGCHICMASVWGSAYYFLFVGVDYGVLVFVPALSGLNLFVSKRLLGD